MNLTTDEADEILSQLYVIYHNSNAVPGVEDCSSNYRRIEVILQAAKDRPQPAVDKLIEAGDELRAVTSAQDEIESISKYVDRCGRACKAWEEAKSAAPVDPDVDAVMEVVGSWVGVYPEWPTRKEDLRDMWNDLRTRLTKLFNTHGA
jgi:hypothetical protein